MASLASPPAEYQDQAAKRPVPGFEKEFLQGAIPNYTSCFVNPVNYRYIMIYLVYYTGWWFGTLGLFSQIVGMMIQSD